MEYGLKHTGFFLDVNSILHRVEIHVRGYYGEVTDLEFAVDPVVIECSCDAIMDVFLTTGAEINLWSNTNTQYLPLHITPPKEVKIIVYRQDEIIFVGYLEPDLYSEELDTAPHQVAIKATDGLKSLENYTPQWIAEADKLTLIEIIKKCLLQAVDLPVNVCCNINSTVLQYAELDNIFTKSSISIEAFATKSDGVLEIKNAYEILESILQSFGCKVYQARGEWFIERIFDRSCGRREYIRYDGDNITKVNYATENVILGTDAAPFYETAPTYEVVAPFGRQTIKQDLEEPDSLILNNFRSDIAVKNLGWADYYDREKWFKKYPIDNIELFTNQHGIAKGITIIHDNTGKTSQAIFQSADCTMSGGDTVSLSFKAAIEDDPANPVGDGAEEPDLRFRYELLSVGWHFNKDGEAIYKRVEGESYIIEHDVKTSDLYSEPAEITLSVKELPPAIGENLTLVLHSAQAIRSGKILKTHLGDIEIKVSRMEFRKPLNSFVAESDKGFIRKADDIEMSINDAPLCPKIMDNLDRRFEYRNVKNLMVYQEIVHAGTEYKYIRHMPISGLYNADETSASARQLAEILLQDHFAQNYSARQMLSATILQQDNNIKLDVLTDYRVISQEGLFIMLSDIFNISAATHEVKIEQLLNEVIEIDHG